jgi:hypothetical protein
MSYTFGLGEGARFTCQLYNKVGLAMRYYWNGGLHISRLFLLYSKVAYQILVVVTRR